MITAARLPTASRTLDYAAQLAAYLACLGFSITLFFKAQFMSSFAILFGDRMDGGIQVALLEHWRNVFAGSEAWNHVLYYYPYRDTLGYNDGFLMFGVPYAVFRRLRADPFLSSELVNIVVRVATFAGTELFLRRSLRVGWALALLGAVVFTTSCNAVMQASHGQLLSAGFVPLFGWLLWTAAEAFGRGEYARSARWGSVSAVFMGAWLLSAYYMAWFALFLSAVMLGLAVVTRPRVAWRFVAGLPRPAWLALALTAVVGLAAVLPFLLVYLPTAATTGMHPFSYPRYYAAALLDLIHVGDGNPLLSWLDAALQHRFRPNLPRNDEHAVGLTLLLLVLFVLALARLWRERALPGVRPVLLLAGATVVVWALTLRIGGAAFWYSVFMLVPGAAALRVIVRYQLLMAGPVVAVVMWYLAGLRSRVSGVVIAALALWLVAEQVTFGGMLSLDRHAELARLDAVPVPPLGCTSFFVLRGRPERTHDAVLDGTYSPNVDAMLVAERLGLPTVGGFSTFTPVDWVFKDPDGPGYLARVQGYAAAHGLTGLCGLDLVTMRWDPAPVAENLPEKALRP